MKESMSPALVSPLVTYLVSDLSKDLTDKTFFVGGGKIAEMRMVTHTGVTKKGAGWTVVAPRDRREDEGGGDPAARLSRWRVFPLP
jgi:hypothetical protein